jgi:hypothetical protein
LLSAEQDVISALYADHVSLARFPKFSLRASGSKTDI